MLRDQASIDINRPIQEVFAFLSNLDKPEGRAFGETQQIPEGPIRAGTVFEYQGKGIMGGMRARTLVMEYVPNRKLTLEQTVSGCFSSRAIYSYTLEQVGPDTRLTLLMERNTRGLFKPFEWLMSSFPSPVGMSMVEMALSSLKTTLQARPRIAEASEPELEEAPIDETQDAFAPERGSPSLSAIPRLSRKSPGHLMARAWPQQVRMRA